MHPTVVENNFLRVGFHSGHEVGVLARVGGHPHSENEPLVFFLEFLTKVPFKMDATALTYMRWFIGCEPGPADMVAHRLGAFFGKQPSKMDHKARIAHAYRLRTGGSPTVFDVEVVRPPPPPPRNFVFCDADGCCRAASFRTSTR
jgi:hypothetical protein